MIVMLKGDEIMSYIICGKYESSKESLYDLEVKHCLTFKSIKEVKRRLKNGEYKGKIYKLVEFCEEEKQ